MRKVTTLMRRAVTTHLNCGFYYIISIQIHNLLGQNIIKDYRQSSVGIMKKKERKRILLEVSTEYCLNIKTVH